MVERSLLCGVGFMSLALMSVSAGAAEQPPRWEIVSVCEAHPEDALCPRAESDARRSILDRWSAVPLQNRAVCLEKLSSNVTPGWRKLASCLDELAFRDFERAPVTNSALPSADRQPRL